jgi:hypothetical protein
VVGGSGMSGYALWANATYEGKTPGNPAIFRFSSIARDARITC